MDFYIENLNIEIDVKIIVLVELIDILSAI